MATNWKLNRRLETANRILTVLLALSLAGCAALPDVMQAAPAVVSDAASMGAAVGAMETARGIGMVLQEGSGAFIMAHGQDFLLAWPKGNAWEFVLVNAKGLPINGIKLDVYSFSDLVKQLEALGWEYTAPAALPAALSELILLGTSAFPSIFVLPAILLPTPIPQELT